MVGLLYWRNPSPKTLEARFTPAGVLELPMAWQRPDGGRDAICWVAADLRLHTAQNSGRRRIVRRTTPGSNSGELVGVGASEELLVSLGPFEVHAMTLRPEKCRGR